MTFSFWNGVAQGAVVGLLWGIMQAQIVPRPIAHPNSVPRPGEYRRRLPYLTKRCS
jgi:hypothetical protein